MLIKSIRNRGRIGGSDEDLCFEMSIHKETKKELKKLSSDRVPGQTYPARRWNGARRVPDAH